MTQISNIYDGLHTLIKSVLTEHSRLPNAYDLANNPEHLLASGYALIVGSGLNTEELLSSKLTITREFRLILTRRLFALPTDATKKGTSEKIILEDLIAVARALEADPYLNGLASPDICFAKFVSDEGLSLIEETEFIQATMIFNIKYFEKIGGI